MFVQSNPFICLLSPSALLDVLKTCDLYNTWMDFAVYTTVRIMVSVLVNLGIHTFLPFTPHYPISFQLDIYADSEITQSIVVLLVE